jgi:hypothetical protein
MVLLAVGWLTTAMRVSHTGDVAILWWFPLTAALVVVGSMLVHGFRATVYPVVASVFVVGAIWQIHAGFRVAYLDGDIAVETLIYNTTSPDVNQVATDLRETSYLLTGDDSLAIQVETCESLDWPFRWHLRDMPNVSYVSALPEVPAPIVIGSLPEWSEGSCQMPGSIPGYTSQQIVLRWHEPERSIYRNFAIAPELEPGRSAWKDRKEDHGPVAIVDSVLSSLGYAFTPAGQRRLIDLLMYRQLDAPLNSFFINVYIRNDILPYYSEARYGN